MSPDNPPLRVLIIEDDTDIAELLDLLLTERGYLTHILESRSASAGELLSKFLPHAVILDYSMPGIPAKDFICDLRIRHPQVQFILSTGRLDAAAELSDEFGIPVLAKPFEPEKLFEIVERVTGSGRCTAVSSE